MSGESIEYEIEGGYIDKYHHTQTEGVNSPAVVNRYRALRWLVITADGIEMTISVADGLAELRDEPRKVLDHDGTAVLDVGGEAVEIDVSDGTATRKIDTEESVEVQAVGLSDHPTEPSDTVVIEP